MTKILRPVGALSIALLFGSALLAPSTVLAHCQIPCGIYDDERVASEVQQHIDTIEKSMQQIIELSKDPKTNANQLVRWVMNKEDHADKIQHTVLEYFLAQRVKLEEAGKEGYDQKLARLHELIVYAMKCKQTTDLKNVEALRKSLAGFEKLYFHEHE